MTPSLAIFGSLAISELVLIGAVALMVFGGKLPEVLMRGAAQVMRARKVVTRMWREAGLEQELRRVQWEIERKMPREADYELRYPNAAVRTTPNPPVVVGHVDDDEHDPEGHDPEAHARLDPVIDFGAPPGTVSQAERPSEPPASAIRDPDPAPKAPDLPPRDPA